MPRRNSTDACGNTMRTQESKSSDRSGQNYINNEIITATDGTVDYGDGQPLYEGDARCDPARDGQVDTNCCN